MIDSCENEGKKLMLPVRQNKKEEKQAHHETKKSDLQLPQVQSKISLHSSKLK
jgi:hypothetical protein